MGHIGVRLLLEGDTPPASNVHSIVSVGTWWIDKTTGVLKECTSLSPLTYVTVIGGGSHPDLASHNTLGLTTQDELDTHIAAVDPHSVYQKESEKGVANGYAALDALGLVPVAQLPSIGGSDINWREFTYVADLAGIVKTNIGTTFVELGLASLRKKIDLTGFVDCRICIGINKIGTGTQSWKFQYSLDQSVWVDLTPVVADSGVAGEKLLVGSFGTIPILAKADVFVRVVGNSTIAADDPVVKSCHLQVK